MEKMEHEFLPDTEPISEVELLIFLLDGSGSMTETKTPDGREKVEYLIEILNGEGGLIERLRKSESASRYRVHTIYFSEKIEEEKGYIELKDVIIKNAVEVAGGGQTAIAKAIDNATKILDEFSNDQMLPKEKWASAFLFTDGQENMGGNVQESANRFKTHLLSPILAIIGIGEEADENLLLEIANYATDKQRRHLDEANVLKYLPDRDKLYLRGHEEGILTRDKAEILRQFVYVLSTTKIEKL